MLKTRTKSIEQPQQELYQFVFFERRRKLLLLGLSQFSSLLDSLQNAKYGNE